MNVLIENIKAEILKQLARRLAMPLLEAAVPSDLRRALPAIYESLDGKMPELMLTASPLEVTCEIGGIISQKLHRVVTCDDIRAVIRLYDPVAAARRNSRVV